MSLKVNIIYDGIIYRVKGMKVLCSVVTAVIMLLIAIVAMGVWMIVSVYGEEPFTYGAVNASTSIQDYNKVAAPSIDFKKPPSVIDTTTRIKTTTPSSSKEEKQSPPEPNLALFGADLYDLNQENQSPKPSEERKIEEDENFVPSRRMISPPEPSFNFHENFNGHANLPPRPPSLTPKNIYQVFNEGPHSLYNLRSSESKDLVDLEMNYPVEEENYHDYSQNEQQIPSKNDSNGKFSEISREMPINFAHRSGIADDDLTYHGPPVVGYGTDPYERMSKDKLDEYNHFWKHFGSGESLSMSHHKENTHVDVVEAPFKLNGPMRPVLRGLRPSSKNEYDIPIRPDAQMPSHDPDLIPSPSTDYIRPFKRPSRHEGPALRPPVRRVPLRTNPNRKLYVGTQPPPSVPKVPSRPTSSHILNPIQEMYDFSKRLAASLLSFNMKPDNQIKDYSDKIASHGIKLLEDYNNIFQTLSDDPLSTLASIFPTTESIRSLDPFKLSLVTWTFLDFWEFLIEKVGTLSDDDLKLLQERLDKLRKRKDSIMTKALVNETLIRISDNSGRSQDVSEVIQEEKSMDKSKNAEEVLTEDQRSISANNRSLNITALEQILLQVQELKSSEIEKSEKTTGNILKDAFPLLSIVNSNHSTTPTPSSEIGVVSNLSTVSSHSKNDQFTEFFLNDPALLKMVGPRSARMWDPLGLFSSEGRMQFMQFAVKVVFNFGKVYLKKSYALDCIMLLFCKDLNQSTKKGGIDGMAAKLKSVGLKVLTESDKQLRETDTFHEIWRSVTAWTPLQCDVMFPRCDGSKALEIVNEVALGGK